MSKLIGNAIRYLSQEQLDNVGVQLNIIVSKEYNDAIEDIEGLLRNYGNSATHVIVKGIF